MIHRVTFYAFPFSASHHNSMTQIPVEHNYVNTAVFLVKKKLSNIVISN